MKSSRNDKNIKDFPEQNVVLKNRYIFYGYIIIDVPEKTRNNKMIKSLHFRINTFVFVLSHLHDLSPRINLRNNNEQKNKK